jgi:transposase
MRTFVSRAAAGKRLLAALVPDVRVLDVHVEPECFLLTVAPKARTAACPRCATRSSRIHSYYIRRPADLPMSGRVTRLLLHARRFRCVNAACPTVTFAERLPNLVLPAAQRTVRLNAALRDLALAFGGQAGARQSARSAMPASGDTLLRRAYTAPLPSRPTPRILGIDDFAFQKGRVYGSILTDGETHAVVDLLPDRSAETVTAWLQVNPGVEIVTRDRSTEYARGVSAGAPDAVQVADRWHVLGNLREALERLLHRLRPQLLLLPVTGAQPLSPLTSIDRDRRRGTLDQVRQQASRAQRYARYADVKHLQAEGKAIIQIARELKLSRQTVRKYMASECFPEHARPRPQPSKLDPYVDVLQTHWDAGCHHNQQLLEAIRAAGYQGSIRAVVQWTMLRRPLLPGYRQPSGRKPARLVEPFVPPEEHAAPPSEDQSLPASRQLAWLLFHFDDRIDETGGEQRTRLCRLPELDSARALVRRFRALLRDRVPEGLAGWITDCQTSGIAELKTFADGLQREEEIIRAALELPYSNGVTEGHVNRLKMIKRTAYGRASFGLLRQRVLAQV